MLVQGLLRCARNAFFEGYGGVLVIFRILVSQCINSYISSDYEFLCDCVSVRLLKFHHIIAMHYGMGLHKNVEEP